MIFYIFDYEEMIILVLNSTLFLYLWIIFLTLRKFSDSIIPEKNLQDTIPDLVSPALRLRYFPQKLSIWEPAGTPMLDTGIVIKPVAQITLWKHKSIFLSLVLGENIHFYFTWQSSSKIQRLAHFIFDYRFFQILK